MVKRNVTLYGMDAELLGRIEAAATREGRSLSNFVAFVLANQFPAEGGSDGGWHERYLKAFPPAVPQGRQVDLVEELSRAPRRASARKSAARHR